MTPEEREAEIKRLEGLLNRRRGKPGFSENVRYIEARLEELRAEQANG